jgi:tetratricopeptide (TPR) repeat protein
MGAEYGQLDEESIYHAAAAKPATERVAFLREACRGDQTLQARVETLLESRDQAGDFLETPILGLDSLPDDTPVSEGPGTVIGRYKLLEKIGEGGMAVVYMAEQERPIRRKVALKVIKLGMDTRQVIARFEAERQALALMDHPSIAKVLDAGATETGRPYFVMELVQGVSITEYCDGNNLSTKDRLALFVQVCNAVQHAHQKGIIHRDIKPSNVMVTHHDGKPVPKVIDFGIAKATNQRLTEKTLFTRYAHLIGTPAYMSPEQAELSDLDIDTRTDIYSLGVLLYELLTGTTPFSEEELRKAGYVEMQRVIREQEPVKPSTKISTLGDTSAEIAKRRSSTPDLLRRAVRGDLDWIVMKSLEKDRARRYETPNGLAEDIRRHLEHEPVVARGPSVTYRVERFLRRHRVQAVAILALVVVAVAAGVMLSMWNRDRAELAEAEGLKHRNILSQAREQYAKAEREAALATIKPILTSKHAGAEARLLRATILVDNRQSKEAMTVLSGLLDEKPAVAGAAHSLLARILWESGSPDAQKLQEIEEHRKQAEAMLPETAEAYFLRAMTALTVKEQLASLDKALQLDSGHYESRRLRAYTYYASRKYDRLRDDALAMTILRPRDPLGYGLRAKASRELGRYPEAIADFSLAIALTAGDEAQQVDLRVQQSETLLRMGDYERVLAEATAEGQAVPRVAGILPAIRGRDALDTVDRSPLQYHAFAALTALGEYDAATALFREIIAPGHESRQKFRDWCAKYVFDTLDAGRSWHPPEQKPVGAAFLPMVEAEETYRSLSSKARRVVTDGFTARYSPDAKKIAFSAGFWGYSGLALYDVQTGQTDLLIVPGKDPAWSPDGRYLAFVRDCAILPMIELAETERVNRHRVFADEEVWLMNADGTQPRRLAAGGFPTWSSDAEHIYYQSPRDNMLYKLAIEGDTANPQRLLSCPDRLPAISPDERLVAYVEGGSLRVVELASQKIVSQPVLPFPVEGGIWSSGGREICFGGLRFNDLPPGLWIYDLEEGQARHVLNGPLRAISLAPNGTKLSFNVGAPYYEIWAADLDPKGSMVEALGPGRTLEEHFRKILAFYTQRIEADPQDAYAYSSRAQYYDCIGDKKNARADTRRWSAILSGGSPQDGVSTMRGKFPRVIHLPFDCEIVFSAERPVNTIPMMSVAFGQKGRCEMKVLDIPMCITSLLGLSLIAGLDMPDACADFTFGEPVNLGPTVNGPSFDYGARLSQDGLCLHYVEETNGVLMISMATRATKDDPWTNAVNLGGGTTMEDFRVPLSAFGVMPGYTTADGLEIYFGVGFDIYVLKRGTMDANWGPPVSLGPPVNSLADEIYPTISSDGLEMYFSGYRAETPYVRPGGYGQSDLWVTKRATRSDPWGEPVNLGPTVNSTYYDTRPFLSADGLVLLFDSHRPGGYGQADLYMTRRSARSEPWGNPVNLGPRVNSPAFEEGVCLSADGATLYWDCDRPGGYGSHDTWQASIRPIVDFNGDGKIDATDMALLTENWGRSESLCDVGPFAWGDGVVDEKDLRVLMEQLMTPGKQASGVPCDTVLNWVGPGFADS